MPDAPNINLGPKVSPEDAAVEKKETEQSTQRAAAREALKAERERLERLSAQTEQGVAPQTLKSDLLDTAELQRRNPGKHYRYLNAKNTDRMPSRIHKEGYKPVPEAEAKDAGSEAKLGSLVLSEQPREVHEARVAAQKKEGERRLRVHKATMEQVVEGVARELRDKHGISVDTSRLLVNE